MNRFFFYKLKLKYAKLSCKQKIQKKWRFVLIKVKNRRMEG